jgi:ABC-type phosphate/phosphonate transport system permease subunit
LYNVEAKEDQIALKSLKSRLPTRSEALSVFSIFVFFVFSWTLYRSSWYVPSWLEYLSVWSVLIVVAYVLAFALFESAFMLALVVFFSLFFPRKVFKEKYVLQGSSLAVLISVGAVLLQRKINLVYRLELWQLLAYPLVGLLLCVLLVVLLAFLFDRIPLLSRLVSTVVERMVIFVYIYVPLGLLALLVVLVRNIIGF